MELLVLLISTIAIILLGWFWLWMFREMLNDAYIPPSAKNYWIFAFVFLNVFAAIFYYVYMYRNQ